MIDYLLDLSSSSIAAAVNSSPISAAGPPLTYYRAYIQLTCRTARGQLITVAGAARDVIAGRAPEADIYTHLYNSMSL
jgi:hypothetical protein